MLFYNVKRGIYAYININDVPLFIDYYKSEKTKLDFNQSQIDVDQYLSGYSNPLLFYYELIE